MDYHKLDCFLDEIEHKKIICFGRGRGLLSFLFMLYSNDCQDHVEAIVDNDSDVIGSVVSNYGTNIRTYTVDYLKEKNPREYVIVITIRSNLAVKSVKDQLSMIPELTEIPIYFYGDLYDAWVKGFREKSFILDIKKGSQEACIPKTIHYCWFGRKKIPDEYKKWMDSWVRFCPDYEIVEWNEDNYDYTKNKYMRQAYEACAWGFVPDFARLDIIYEHGGVYLDTDVELIKPLDDLLYEEAFAGCTVDGKVALGLGFGATPHMPIMKELLSVYDDLEFCPMRKKKDRALIQPAPDIQTIFIKNKWKWKYTGKVSEVEGMQLYPFPMLDGLKASEEEREKYSFSIHHYSGSWMPKE